MNAKKIRKISFAIINFIIIVMCFSTILDAQIFPLNRGRGPLPNIGGGDNCGGFRCEQFEDPGEKTNSSLFSNFVLSNTDASESAKEAQAVTSEVELPATGGLSFSGGGGGGGGIPAPLQGLECFCTAKDDLVNCYNVPSYALSLGELPEDIEEIDNVTFSGAISLRAFCSESGMMTPTSLLYHCSHMPESEYMRYSDFVNVCPIKDEDEVNEILNDLGTLSITGLSESELKALFAPSSGGDLIDTTINTLRERIPFVGPTAARVLDMIVETAEGIIPGFNNDDLSEDIQMAIIRELILQEIISTMRSMQALQDQMESDEEND